MLCVVMAERRRRGRGASAQEVRAGGEGVRLRGTGSVARRSREGRTGIGWGIGPERGWTRERAGYGAGRDRREMEGELGMWVG